MLKLPQLRGSTKQISWAENIRKCQIAEITDYGLSEYGRKCLEELLASYERLEARWWIINRDNRNFIDKVIYTNDGRMKHWL